MAFAAAPATGTAAFLRADQRRRQEYVKRRQDILRSYQLCRKQAPGERVRRTVVRVRRLVCTRLGGACRLPRLLWATLRSAVSGGGGGVRRRISRRFCFLVAFHNLRDRLSGRVRSGSGGGGGCSHAGDSPGPHLREGGRLRY